MGDRAADGVAAGSSLGKHAEKPAQHGADCSADAGFCTRTGGCRPHCVAAAPAERRAAQPRQEQVPQCETPPSPLKESSPAEPPACLLGGLCCSLSA